jgi:hypothetical protein
MSDDTGLPDLWRRFARWATTPPQAYGVYLIVLVLVWLVSFYAGTLKPQKGPEAVPPPASAPRN